MTSRSNRPPFWNAYGWRLIGFALFGVILWWVGIRGVARVFFQAQPAALALALAVATILAATLVLLRALRWRVLCGGLSIPLPFAEAVRFCLVGAFVGAATPGHFGDLVRAYYVRERRPSGGWAAGIASVVYDRLLDLGQITALALGAVVVLPGIGPQWGPAFVAVGLAAFVWTTVWGPTRQGLLAAPLGWALRRLPGGDGVAPQALPVGKIIAAQALTLAALACFVGEIVVLARGLGITQPSWWSLGVLAALGTLVGLLPITISGIGTRDAVYVAAAPLLGVTREALLSLSLLLLALYGLIGVLGWAAWASSAPGDRKPPA